MRFELRNLNSKETRVELVPTTPTPDFFNIGDQTGAIGTDPVTGALTLCLSAGLFDCTPSSLLVDAEHSVTWPEAGVYIGVSVNDGPIVICRAVDSWRPPEERKSFDAIIEAVSADPILVVQLIDHFEIQGWDEQGNPVEGDLGIVGVGPYSPVKVATKFSFHDVEAPGLNLFKENNLEGNRVDVFSCGRTFMPSAYFMTSPSPVGNMIILQEQRSYRVDSILENGKQAILNEKKFDGYQIRHMRFSQTGAYVTQNRDDWSSNPSENDGKWAFKIFEPKDGVIDGLWLDGTEVEVRIDHDGDEPKGCGELAWSVDDQYLAVVPWQDSHKIYIYKKQPDGSFKRVSVHVHPQELRYNDITFSPYGTAIIVCHAKLNNPSIAVYAAHDFTDGVIGAQWTSSGTWEDLPLPSETPANYKESDFVWMSNVSLQVMRTWGYQYIELDNVGKTITGTNTSTFPIYPSDPENAELNKNVSYTDLVLLDGGKKPVSIWNHYIPDAPPDVKDFGMVMASFNPTTKKTTSPPESELRKYNLRKPTADQRGMALHPLTDNLFYTVCKDGPWYTQWWELDNAGNIVENFPNGGGI